MSKNELRTIRKIAFRIGFGLELGKIVAHIIKLSISKGFIKVLDDAVEKVEQKTEEAEKDIQDSYEEIVDETAAE